MIATRENTAHRMVALAARLFKQRSGNYPERIGLDWFTRMSEYTEQYGEWYITSKVVAVSPLALIAFARDRAEPEAQVTVERVVIKIVPAIFGKPTYYPDLPIIRSPPKEGRDEVLCEGNGEKVAMTIWFTDGGYHAILW